MVNSEENKIIMDDNQIERLKAEWDQEKNAPLRFEDVTPGSDRKVWWR